MRKHVKEKGNTNYTLGEKMYAIQLTKQSCQKYRKQREKEEETERLRLTEEEAERC